jgi:hypothetical protein
MRRGFGTVSGGGRVARSQRERAAYSTTILTIMYAPCEVANTVISSPDWASGMIVCSNQVRQRFMKLVVWGEDSVTKRGHLSEEHITHWPELSTLFGIGRGTGPLVPDNSPMSRSRRAESVFSSIFLHLCLFNIAMPVCFGAILCLNRRDIEGQTRHVTHIFGSTQV